MRHNWLLKLFGAGSEEADVDDVAVKEEEDELEDDEWDVVEVAEDEETSNPG